MIIFTSFLINSFGFFFIVISEFTYSSVRNRIDHGRTVRRAVALLPTKTGRRDRFGSAQMEIPADSSIGRNKEHENDK